jgi:ankyrin repeat protein
VAKQPDTLLVQDNDGCTPLLVAAQMSSTMSASAMIRATRGIGPALDKSRKTELHHAAESG